MKVVAAFPPNYDTIAMLWSLPPTAIFAWGNKIYNPSGRRISGDLMAHEEVHQKQQEALGGPEKWWQKYIEEDKFRLDQEAKAYGRQLQYICSQNPNRNYQFQVLQALALMLCGPMYGHLATMDEAMELVKRYA